MTKGYLIYTLFEGASMYETHVAQLTKIPNDKHQPEKYSFQFDDESELIA